MDPILIGRMLEFVQHLVFWCSIASLVLAVIERWTNKWFPNHSKWVSAVADLVSQFGALNLRSKIVNGSAPKPAQGPEDPPAGV